MTFLSHSVAVSLRLVLALPLLLACTVLNAQSSEDGETAEEPSTLSRIDDFHSTVSDGFSDMIGGVDDFFASTEGQTQLNRSWMRLRFDVTKFESDSVEGRLNAKLKLILPRSEKRVRLLVSTEEEDTRDPGERNINQQSLAEANENGNLSLALRFLQSVKERNSLKFDVGARVRDGKAQTFGRISASSSRRLGANVDFRISNNLWYFSSSGYDNRLSINFERSFPRQADVLARSSTQISWLEDSKGAGIGQTFGLYRVIDPRKFLALELLSSYRTARSSGEGDRFAGSELRLRFRHNIWRPWFYYEIWPQMRWRAEDDYEGTFGALARIEVVVGRRADKKAGL